MSDNEITMMTNQDLITIMKRYGTPTYVFDTEALKKRVRAIQSLWGEKIKLCYSIKANPFLIPAMLEVVNHLEVCSPGELEICENLKVPMRGIVYSGVNKEPADIHQAVSDGVGICTAESIRQVKLLEKAAGRSEDTTGSGEGMKSDYRLPLLLRLNSGSQFGMSGEDLLYVIRHRADYPHLSFEGIHYFVGTQRKNRDLHQQKEELEMLHDLFKEIRAEEGFVLKKLEYGPGLPVPLFAKEDFSDTLAPAREIADTLKSVTEWADLTVEAGRFFTTECGHYLTKVVDLKTVSTASEAGKNYCIVDGGINHVNYLGQIMGMKLPVIRHFRGNGDPDADPAEVHYKLTEDDISCSAGRSVSKQEQSANGGETRSNSRAETDHMIQHSGNMSSGKSCIDGNEMKDYEICGSLCTTNDALVRSCQLSGLRPGDVLVFDNIGAYSVTEGIYLFLSRKMPRIVLYNGDSDIRMVRDCIPTSPLNTPET